ncbi:hypothetical protein JOC77_000192 [Peribacillus deserti]|uniref:Uncharacterized protein n=1 Tax=Peribacillus deserti TaxID=673318 RepID=A0ABS2QCD6_9BACI|nr:hypothetical protein [Peribacillus deserti]MBM7690789.1 hypothetical protein [Peribacillus deserti]
MYRKRNAAIIFIAFVVALLLLILSVRILFSPVNGAKSTVNDFYQYEAKGEYSKSWSFLHPLMKERWPKAAYIQDRVHVFIGHFGTDTFTFTIDGGDKIKKWKMAKGMPPFKTVYQFQVTQHYKGKYGKFKFIQDVYIVKNKGKWEILWDYNQ